MENDLDALLLDALLDEYDRLTEDLYFCKADLSKRRKLLERRLSVRRSIENLIATDKALSK